MINIPFIGMYRKIIIISFDKTDKKTDKKINGGFVKTVKFMAKSNTKGLLFRIRKINKKISLSRADFFIER